MTSSGFHTIQERNRGRYHILHGGWVFTSNRDSVTLFSPQGDSQALHIEDCAQPASLLAALPEPAAMLMSCATDRGDEMYLYWTPERTRRFQVPRLFPRETWGGPMKSEHPIIGRRNTSTEVATGLWFDMRSGQYWQGERLFPLFGGFDNAPQFFATNVNLVDGTHDDPVYLFHVDIDAGQEQLIHVYDDCPGFLSVSDSRADALAFLCLVKHERLFQFRTLWSEVVSTAGAYRWRPRQEVLYFTDDGRAILTDRRYTESFRFRPARNLWITADPVIHP